MVLNDSEIQCNYYASFHIQPPFHLFTPCAAPVASSYPSSFRKRSLPCGRRPIWSNQAGRFEWQVAVAEDAARLLNGRRTARANRFNRSVDWERRKSDVSAARIPMLYRRALVAGKAQIAFSAQRRLNEKMDIADALRPRRSGNEPSSGRWALSVADTGGAHKSTDSSRSADKTADAPPLQPREDSRHQSVGPPSR
jgi:hypothetical protein